jgi:hypothetical protein
LDDDALAFVKPPAARQNIPCWQEGRPVAADINEQRVERRQQPADASEMDAADFAPVTALDVQFDRDAVLEQRRAPLARAGGDQQFVGQRRR